MDDPLIPESKARTVESVIEEVGFDARDKFNRTSNSFKGFKKSILIALGKDTTTFTISYWNNVARVYENDKVVQEVVKAGSITHTFTSTDSIKYIVLYSNFNSYGDCPQSQSDKVNAKWVVFGNEYKVTSILWADYIISYHKDNTFNDYGYLKRLRYSGAGQLRLPEDMEWIGGQFFRECSLPNITSIRIPKNFKGSRKLAPQHQYFPFYGYDKNAKCEYIHYLGTLEDWLRVSFLCWEDISLMRSSTGFGNGKAVLKFGENYDTPTEANFPEDMTSIGYRVLSAFPQFTKIAIPAGISEINNMAFYEQINADIYVDKTLEDYKQISFGQYWHNMDTTRDLYLKNQKITEVTINSNEELKGDYRSPFESFSIEKLTIADEVTTIPINAFRKCNLKEIDWGTGLTKISDYAFLTGFSSDLKVLNIPEGVVTIGSQAFRYCTPEEVVIPASCTSVGSLAFADNFPLKVTILNPETKFGGLPFTPSRYEPTWEIHFNGTLTQFCNLTNVNELGCKRLYLQGTLVEGEIVIPAEATLRYAVFERNYDITKVVIQEGVTSIGQDVFYRCRYVEEIDLPSTITSFGSECFGAMGGYAETFKCTFRWTDASKILPPGNTYLTRGNKSTLYVPQGMTQAYRDAGYTEALWPNMIEY